MNYFITCNMKRTIQLTESELKNYIRRIINESYHGGRVTFICGDFEGEPLEKVCEIFSDKGFKGTDSYINGPDSATYAMARDNIQLDIIYNEKRIVKKVLIYI